MDIIFHLTTNNEDNHCHMDRQYLVTRKQRKKNQHRLVNWTANPILVVAMKKNQDISGEVSSGKDSLWKPSSRKLGAVLLPYVFRCISSSEIQMERRPAVPVKDMERVLDKMRKKAWPVQPSKVKTEKK